MLKFVKRIFVIFVVLSLFALGGLLDDRNSLKNGIVRLHVVANSDSTEDQQIKLSVRDAILAYLNENMPEQSDVQAVKEYLQTHLGELRQVANDALAAVGSDVQAAVSLTKEKFGIRKYDTFTLPSGVYEALRIEIGEAAGQNWWCVVFPALCTGVTTEDFKITAASSGLNADLTNTLAREDGYEIRFFLLDWLGKVENFFSGK